MRRWRHVSRPTILTFSQGYLPGFRHGGPVRTLANLVERLGDEFDFRIITADRDSGEMRPYEGILRDQWQPVGKAQVYYASPVALRPSRLMRLLRDTPHDVMYLNSFFSPRFTIVPLGLRRAGLVPRRPVIVAPRGEFSPAALSLKAWKKSAYRRVARAFGLYSHVIWQASSDREEVDIRREFGTGAVVFIAPNLAPAAANNVWNPPIKPHGRLRIVFLSRIVPMKNLLGALSMLDRVRGEITFDVYGPREDERYWSECEVAIRRLPPNVRVRVNGPIENGHVEELLARYDLLLLPTLGENYGHVIVEAFRSGCPVLISNRTPWRDLADKGVGWDLPLEDPDRFREALQACVDMGPDDYAAFRERVRRFGMRISADEEVIALNRTLFSYAARSSTDEAPRYAG